MIHPPIIVEATADIAAHRSTTPTGPALTSKHLQQRQAGTDTGSTTTPVAVPILICDTGSPR
jgi:hypothetical protein